MDRWICSLLAGLVVSLCSSADEVGKTSPPWNMIVQWDNDLLTGTDCGYTNGARFAFSREFAPGETIDHSLHHYLYALSGAEADSLLHDWRFADDGPTRFAWGLGLTQLMFTPGDPVALVAPPGERPYAGWLGLELSLHVKNDRSVSSSALSLGTTGKNSLAQESQDWVHRNISDSPIYQGWDSQVPGEFTLNLHLDHKRRLEFLDRGGRFPLDVDGYFEWGVAVGNLRTNAYVGSMFRAGYNLSATFSTPRVQLGSYGHELFGPNAPNESPFSLLGFAGVRGSAVAHDATLDGPVFRDFDTGVDSRPFVGELVYGASFRYRSLELSVSRTLRSDEFDGQDENQTFGSVMARIAVPFW